MRLRWLIASAAVAVAGVGLAIGVRSRPPLGPKDGHELPPVDTGRVAVDDVAPDFTLLAYGGGPTTLSDFRADRRVILVFYRGHW